MKHRELAAGVLGVAVAVGLGYAVRAARASGIPTTGALSYAGVLEDGSGPINGMRNIQVSFYDSAAAGRLLCQVASAPVSVAGGHFAVSLPDTCTAEVERNPNLWVNVQVDGSDTGRMKAGAVPFAVESKNAANAANAANGSPLAATLNGIQSRQFPASGMHAELTTSASIPHMGPGTLLKFGREDFDLGDEYDPATGLFTAKQTGRYLVSCIVAFEGDPTPSGVRAAYVFVNGVNVAQVVDASASSLATGIEVSTFVSVVAGAAISCRAYQNSGDPVNVLGDASKTQMSVARLN